MKFFSLLFWFLLPLTGHTTSVPPRSLEDLVKESHHVFIAKVVKVDMVNDKNELVKDKKAMTGPGLENEIRLHLEVKEVLYTKSLHAPNKIIVRLWKMWHYQLGDIQAIMTGNTSIFLLEGDEYKPVYPREFHRPLEEKKSIRKLLGK